MNSGPISVASAADDGFAMPMAVMAFSVLDRLEEDTPVQFLMMDGGISNKNKSAIQTVIRRKSSVAEVSWIEPPDQYLKRDWTMRQGLSAATLLKLFLPHLLPSHVKKVLYLDSDLIVNRNLSILWNRSIKDYPIYAVRDFGIPHVSHGKYGIPAYKELGLDPATPYFNAGVLLINADKWEDENISERAVSYLEKYEDVHRFNDQEALNAVTAGDFGKLPIHWNQQSILFRSSRETAPFDQLSEEEYQRLKLSPSIIHFTESPNPWCGRCRHPYRNVFLLQLARSGWFSPGDWMKFRSKYAYESTLQGADDLYQYLCDVSRPYRHQAREKVRQMRA